MDYINDRHKELSARNDPAILQWFGSLPSNRRAVLVGSAVGLGFIGALGAFIGTSSPRQYFCVTLPAEVEQTEVAAPPLFQCINPETHQKWRMTVRLWERWGRDGRPPEIVPHPTIPVEPATNPYKFWFGIACASGFGAAAWMLRHLQNEESQLAVFDDIAQKRDAAKADLQARAAVLPDYRRVATQYAEIEADVDVEQRRAEIYANSELQIAQIDADDLVWRHETEGMTEEEYAQYQHAKYMERALQAGHNVLQLQLEGQTLDEINDPSDKVGGEDSDAIAGGGEQESGLPLLPVEALLETPLLIVFGAPGSGKSRLTRHIARQRQQSGHEVEVLDPHGQLKFWAPFKVHGKGRNYAAIDGAMGQWEQTLTDRYEEFADGRDDFPWHSTVCDEVTTWGSNCAGVEAFIKSATSEPRKVHMGTVIISHGTTLGCLGEAKGLAKTIQNSSTQIELGATLDKATGKAEPTYTCKVRWYGRDKNEWEEYRLDKAWFADAANSPVVAPNEPQHQGNSDRQRLEFLIQSTPEFQPAPAPQLTDRQQAILQYAGTKKDWVTPSELQASVRACRGVSADDIIADFDALTEAGYGNPDTSGRTVKWRSRRQG